MMQYEAFTILDAIEEYPGARREWAGAMDEISALKERLALAERVIAAARTEHHAADPVLRAWIVEWDEAKRCSDG